MTIKNIKSVGKFCIIHISKVIEGNIKNKTLTPLTPRCEKRDISTEPPEVQAVCKKAWTPKVIAAYKAHKAEQL